VHVVGESARGWGWQGRDWLADSPGAVGTVIGTIYQQWAAHHVHSWQQLRNFCSALTLACNFWVPVIVDIMHTVFYVVVMSLCLVLDSVASVYSFVCILVSYVLVLVSFWQSCWAHLPCLPIVLYILPMFFLYFISKRIFVNGEYISHEFSGTTE